jgi:hypothetical protein
MLHMKISLYNSILLVFYLQNLRYLHSNSPLWIREKRSITTTFHFSFGDTVWIRLLEMYYFNRGILDPIRATLFSHFLWIDQKEKTRPSLIFMD